MGTDVIVIVMLQYKCYILSSCLIDFSDWFQIVWFDNLSLITAWTQSRGWLPAGKYHFNSLKIPFSARPGSSSNIFSKQRNKLGKALFEGNIEFLWLNSSFGHRYFLPPSQFDFLTQFHICEIWFDENYNLDNMMMTMHILDILMLMMMMMMITMMMMMNW